jgi:hypothetical protein
MSSLTHTATYSLRKRNNNQLAESMLNTEVGSTSISFLKRFQENYKNYREKLHTIMQNIVFGIPIN